MIRWLSTGNVSAENPHGDGSAEGTDHQELATTKVVNEEQEPDERNNRFEIGRAHV